MIFISEHVLNYFPIPTSDAACVVTRTVSYDDIEYTLMHQRYSRATIMPRYTPKNWWECDVCEITDSGYFREYEIKMSRADFKVDADKSRYAGHYTYLDRLAGKPREIETKHSLLSSGDPRGPTIFNFVTPKWLLKIGEIPAWAGLIEIEFSEYSNYPIDWVTIKAPRLHKTKADAAIREGMLGSAYGRLHGEWNNQYYRASCDRVTTLDQVKETLST